MPEYEYACADFLPMKATGEGQGQYVKADVDRISEAVNAWGAKGWELTNVAYVPGSSYQTYNSLLHYFRREKGN